MVSSPVRWVSVFILSFLLLSCLSCGREQRLVSIEVQPSGGFVFEGPGAQGQFTALGQYVHPAETKDITNQVVWKLDIANFATLTDTGLITYTRNDGCGSGDVSANFYSNPQDPTAGTVITSSAPVKGVRDGTEDCK